MAKTHLEACNLLLFTQYRCVYVNNDDAVQTALLLTEVSKRISKRIIILINKWFIY